MSNAEVASALTQLRQAVASGECSPQEAGPEFERLTLLHTGVGPGVDRQLHALVNDLEVIRFGKLLDNQAPAMQAVLELAQDLFDRLV